MDSYLSDSDRGKSVLILFLVHIFPRHVRQTKMLDQDRSFNMSAYTSSIERRRRAHVARRRRTEYADVVNASACCKRRTVLHDVGARSTPTLNMERRRRAHVERRRRTEYADVVFAYACCKRRRRTEYADVLHADCLQRWSTHEMIAS